jgi:hypothetical protein
LKVIDILRLRFRHHVWCVLFHYTPWALHSGLVFFCIYARNSDSIEVYLYRGTLIIMIVLKCTSSITGTVYIVPVP